ncbi:MAG: glycerate kinase [Bacteroidota bacterium]
MKILIAPDKFKGTLTAAQVCRAVAEGLVVQGHDEIKTLPLADGGEGTFELLMQAYQGTEIKVTVRDPLLRPLQATYGLSQDGTTAFMEMASASGLALLTHQERNPMRTSSAGTGDLIADALDRGAQHIVLGIGGSATNDAGTGMAAALGIRYLDEHGERVVPTGGNLVKIASIDTSGKHPRLAEAQITVLCDVNNPLTGPKGAAFIYGPQKGATPEQVRALNEGLVHYQHLAQRLFGVDIDFPGAGAAGGLGASLRLFSQARLRPGVEYLGELLQLEVLIKSCDWVITGEGRIDEQTFSGKVVSHVVALAQLHHKKIAVVCGQCWLSEVELQNNGVHRWLTLAANEEELTLAMSAPYHLLKAKAEKLVLK